MNGNRLLSNRYSGRVRALVLLGCVLMLGCQGQAPETDLRSAVSSPPKIVAQGVTMREVRLDPEHRLWIYEPRVPAKGRRACIVIAPAGGRMFDGMLLGEGDQPEHLPYVRAGYVVIAYDVSGPLDGLSDAAVYEAARKFAAADAGVADGKRAVDYALKELQIDPARVVTAGHSSAGTIALALAENDSRVKGCLAYAPVVDVRADLGETLQTLESEVPGVEKQLVRFSPAGGKDSLKCPTLIFHAKDDDNVLMEPLRSFAQSLPIVEWTEVTTGGHYDSMVGAGIPAGIAFLKRHRLGP